MGRGLMRRLGRHGIESLITSESDPQAAVTRYLDGSLDSTHPEHSCTHDAGCREHDVATNPEKRSDTC
jgi:hypothetical protein